MYWLPLKTKGKCEDFRWMYAIYTQFKWINCSLYWLVTGTFYASKHYKFRFRYSTMNIYIHVFLYLIMCIIKLVLMDQLAYFKLIYYYL